jgi:hypothetical protein
MGDKMKDKLPKVFANSFSRQISNNEKVYHVREEISKPIEKKNLPSENINNKINALFKSSKYVYKLDVEITTTNGISKKRIIGKNKTNLITLDNELIAINDIIDIKIV